MTSQTRVTLIAGAATLLGAIPLAGGFREQRWFWYAMLAVAVVVGVGVLLRMVHTPAVLIVPAQVAGLLVFHTVVFASKHGYGGVIPNAHTLRDLNNALSDGLHDIQYLAAPVPAQTDIVVLTALAVGLLAIVVDVIAVSLQHPAVAGLALLALFAVATAVSARTLFFEFAGAGAGYLLLLAAEGRERLVRWGRVVSADDPVGRGGEQQHNTIRMPRHSAAGRVGVVAVAMALVVPALVPGFTRNVLGTIGHGSSDGSLAGGAQSLGSGLNPFTQLKGVLDQSHTENLLQVTSNVEPWYLRVTVLDEYTSDGWRRGPSHDKITGIGDGMPMTNELTNLQDNGHVRNVTATIKVTNYRDDRLPVYYSPTSVTGAGSHWRYDTDRSEVVADRGTATTYNQTYTVKAAEPDPTMTDLSDAPPLQASDAVMRRWGTKPPDVRPKVRTITNGIITGKDGPWARANAINNYFTDGSQGFAYSLHTKLGSSNDALLDFLEQKQGYCEQYASAMAVMLRLAGIPSRVVLGYARGTEDDKSKTWTISNKDAHAWVEAYFSGIGWVDFDPTPRDDAVTPTYLRTSDPNSTTPTSTAPSGPASGSTSQRSTQHTESQAAGGGGGPASSGPSGSTTPAIAGGAAAGLLVLLLLFTPTVIRRVGRRRRFALARGPDPIAAAHAAWTELQATLTDLGVSLARAESPRAAAGRLAIQRALDPVASSGLRVVALAEERARYAASAGVDGDLPTALRAARSGLLAGASRRRRFAIALAPPSVMRTISVALAEGYQRLQVTMASMPRTLRFRRVDDAKPRP